MCNRIITKADGTEHHFYYLFVCLCVHLVINQQLQRGLLLKTSLLLTVNYTCYFNKTMLFFFTHNFAGLSFNCKELINPYGGKTLLFFQSVFQSTALPVAKSEIQKCTFFSHLYQCSTMMMLKNAIAFKLPKEQMKCTVR